ncbi:MAG: rhomboid family intramembrane serine protease [Kastovskya adunca ATA6-11-RM4]|jgi:rhomboid protease GluP|nr:rhomboid family intramembrane serine protease [Kastovskya adunca ATA6-11-RM4]
MDLDRILIWMVCLSCLALLLQATRLPLRDSLGWILVSSFILTITAATFYFSPAWAAWVSGSLWAILVMIPLLGRAKVNRLFYQQRYSQAYKLAALLRWLHPADGWLEQPQFLRALELGQQNRMDDALKIFHRDQNHKTPFGRKTIASLYHMGAQWEELLVWVRDSLPEKVLLQEPTLVVYYLRALGETGDLNSLLQELKRFERSLEKSGDPTTINLVRMYALAFCGQTEQVKQMFEHSLRIYSPNSRTFWQATAEMAAGNAANAGEQLRSLENSSDVVTRNAIAWRLSHPGSAQKVLTESSQQILSRIGTEIKQEARYSGRAFPGTKAYGTYALIGLNLLVFALEIRLGGSENIETLYRLGGLVPQLVLAGEWWRLVSAVFLHFGALHLAMNMLGLYFLGTFVERIIGIWRYLLAYFISGVGSMFVIVLLAVRMDAAPQITVGASGAIMGMIGTMAAILLWGWRQEKSRVAARRLRTILFIVGLQVVFDLTTPQVSFVGHASGLVLGFLISLLLLWVWQFKD